MAPPHGPSEQASLTGPQRRLIALFRVHGYGRIEGLRVHNGQPIFNPGPRVIQQIKFGSNEPPASGAAATDLERELFEFLERIGDGIVDLIEFRHGRPFLGERVVEGPPP